MDHYGSHHLFVFVFEDVAVVDIARSTCYLALLNVEVLLRASINVVSRVKRVHQRHGEVRTSPSDPNSGIGELRDIEDLFPPS